MQLRQLHVQRLRVDKMVNVRHGFEVGFLFVSMWNTGLNWGYQDLRQWSARCFVVDSAKT